MSSSSLIRLSGLSALVGGLLITIFNILESVLFGSSPDNASMTSATWVIVELGLLVAAVLIILGLIGLYARQSEQLGKMGLIAFVIAITGTVLLAGIEWSSAFMAPWISGIAPSEVQNAEPSGAFIAGILLTFFLFALGWFLFGLGSVQAGVLSRGAAVLLMVGSILFLVLAFLEVGFEGVVFGAALAWSGYTLWSVGSQPISTAEVRL